jgi:hypothetical protein
MILVLAMSLIVVAVGCNATRPEHTFAAIPATLALTEPATTEESIETWYYVVGEIRMRRAQLAFESAITVRMAIESAGGFTSSANKKKVQVFSRDGERRVVDCTDSERNPEMTVRIRRGDYIYVPRSSKWLFW